MIFNRATGAFMCKPHLMVYAPATEYNDCFSI